ncbi:MAG: DJ-1/PfpI family protein [Bacteroidales bacterium]|nr:DJ-1/PfpI family protein [Bacteroidales bacterium]
MDVAILLFADFETLDVFGPVEIFGRASDLYSIKFYSLKGGSISNKQGVSIVTHKLDSISPKAKLLLVPGGMGTRTEVNNDLLISKMKKIAIQSDYVLTVCTGSALLAKTGLLDNKEATSNKKAFSWVITTGKRVLWNRKARWTTDGKFYTSSGVSAGMDMVLGFLSDRHGIDFARQISTDIEYLWTENKDCDTFTAE